MKKILAIVVLGVPIVCQKKLLQLTKHRETWGRLVPCSQIIPHWYQNFLLLFF